MIDVTMGDKDLKTSETSVPKAVNLLSIQEGELVYARSWGIDLELFFNPSVEIQTEVFEKYSIRKMAENGINIVDFLRTEGTFDTIFRYVVSSRDTNGELII